MRTYHIALFRLLQAAFRRGAFRIEHDGPPKSGKSAREELERSAEKEGKQLFYLKFITPIYIYRSPAL